ncbi:MAG: hypothetical protein GF308_18810 [Candidatus Heimdallarchaeota archaeon]|nr:hypothetical protein [Candidatus Heimdallarchaeota archaeon]
MNKENPKKLKNSIIRIIKIGFQISIFFSLIFMTKLPSMDNSVHGHSTRASPIELFSLWNDSSPLINGEISFTQSENSNEWSSAAIYPMFDADFSPTAKLFLQNDNDNLFIGMDMTNQQTENPPSKRGCGIYLDRNHDGRLNSDDRAILLFEDSSDSHLIYYQYSNGWQTLEQGDPGDTLPTSQIKADDYFGSSAFETTAHYQYEIKIPLSELNSQSGRILGISFEAFENYNSNDEEITWPYISTTPSQIRSQASKWGDLYLGVNLSSDNPYAELVVEENKNIKSNAIGYNNGTFLTSGDINGDGDLEIIVSSNRTVIGSNNLLAIFDYVNNEFTRIWASWESSYQSKLFLVRGIATYDFNDDGEEEIFVCGTDSRILRFSDWNANNGDFDASEYIFTHTSGLMGYITINDVDNDDKAEIVCGDQSGKVIILAYNSGTDSFSHDIDSPLTPKKVGPTNIQRVHAVDIADMDGDNKNELLLQVQPTIDNSLSTTYLEIFEFDTGPNKYKDNLEDDLPLESSEITTDRFGHSIIVGDVDNDLVIETIIIGRDYLKIFGNDSFADATPPLEFSINDNSNSPKMGGGGIIADINDDGNNELIFGYNNGTIKIVKIVDSGIEDLTYSTIWSGDFGASLGKREAIVAYDFDLDTELELIMGDNFGQMFIFGKSDEPQLTITSPTSGSSVSEPSVTIEWNIIEDLSIHHYDLFVNDQLTARAGGGQTSFILPMAPGENTIELVSYDVVGKSDIDSITVFYSSGAPTVDITSPQNNYETQVPEVEIQYSGSDPDGDIDYYEIYRNDELIESGITGTTYLLDLPSDGSWKITVKVVDDTDLTSQDSIYVILDREKPEIDITSPNNGTAVKNTEIELQWTASDALTSMDYYEVFKDGDLLGTTSNQEYFISLDFDKSYSLKVIAYDSVGNYKTDSVIITRDTIKPEVGILSPESDLYVESSIITLTWNATDKSNGTGIDISEVTVNEGLVYSGTQQSVEINLGSEGVKDIAVTAYDRAGNTAKDFRLIIVDNTDPIINIRNPEDNYTTSLNYVSIFWDSIDNGTGVKEYQVFLDGKLNQTITNPDETFSILTIPENQTSTISVKAIDYLDHEAEDSIKIIQDPTAPTLAIVNPIQLFAYLSTSTFNLTWEVSNLNNIEYFEIYINNTLNCTHSNDKRTCLVDFGDIPENTFPFYNITIKAVLSNSSLSINDFRLIQIDQNAPSISITTPSNDEIILEQGLYVGWIGQDLGSSISKYKVQLNQKTINEWSKDKTSQYINFNEGDGTYNLTIFAYDKAGNSANNSIRLQVYISPPLFEHNIPNPYIINFDSFQFNLSIPYTSLGVNLLEVKVDGESLINYDYEDSPKNDPFWLLVNITQLTDDPSTSSEHNISIIVKDISNRENSELINIYIDHRNPTVFNTAIIDREFWGSETQEIEIKETGNNWHNFTLQVTDDSEISKVELTIIGNETQQTYEMNYSQTIGQTTEGNMEISIYEFQATINFDNLPTGNYQIIFTMYDISGNTNIESYDLLLSEPEQSWISKPTNLLIVILGSILFVIISILLSITLSRVVANIGWKEEIQAVAYVMNTGLTSVYVPYTEQFVEEEQLFGGAMSGVMSILEEITGEKTETKVHKVEFGNKMLLLFPRKYGTSIVLVNKVKPIIISRLEEFAEEFEQEYKGPLINNLYVRDTDFATAPILVETYFGISQVSHLAKDQEEMDVQEEQEIEKITDEEILSFEEEIPREKTIQTEPEMPQINYQEIVEQEEETSLEKELEKLSPQKQELIIQLIEKSKEAIFALSELNQEDAENKINTIISSLDVLLKDEEGHTKEIDELLASLLNISKEVYQGIECLQAKDQTEALAAAQRASQLWIEKIGQFSG